MASILNAIFFLYFFTHIPITILFDSQSLFLNCTEIMDLYPIQIREMVQSYSKSFKDPMVVDPPYWFKSFIACELLLQFPFFFVAVYAFAKGGCRWIRIPAIVYSAHVTTTVMPIIAHILLHDFTDSKHPGPSTPAERLWLTAIYSPYLLIPLLLLLVMLFSSQYRSDGSISKSNVSQRSVGGAKSAAASTAEQRRTKPKQN